MVALSTDPRDDARGTANLTGALYPIVYGLNAQAVQGAIGGYMNLDPPYLQASSFILRPDGTVALANYASGELPRLRATEAASYIEYLKRKMSDG